MRSYALPGTARDYDPQSNESLADFIKRQNLGSFTLGPFEVNPLELVQCRCHARLRRQVVPAQPDRQGIRPPRQGCLGHHSNLRAGRPEGLANTLANAMSKDDTGRAPPPGRRARSGWNLPMSGKTGTTEAHRSSASSDSPTRWPPPSTSTATRRRRARSARSRCASVVRRNLFGGNEPARTWFSAMKPIANNFGAVELPPTDPRYVEGGPGSRVPSVSAWATTRPASGSRGRLPGCRRADSGEQRLAFGRRGGHLAVGRPFPARSSPSWSATASRLASHRHRRSASRGCRRRIGETVIQIPGLPPITVPVLGPPPPPPPPPVP